MRVDEDRQCGACLRAESDDDEERIRGASEGPVSARQQGNGIGPTPMSPPATTKSVPKDL